MKIKPCQSTAFHPQLDGQTECVNQIMETYLRCDASSSQDTWLSDLPLAEFAYNNSDHNSTGASPFFVNYGFNPNFSISPNWNSSLPKVTHEVNNLKKVHTATSENLELAVIEYKKYAD